MKYLITGITGTLGQAVMKLLLEDGHSVVGLSRDEMKQRALPTHSRLKLFLGDVRDERRVVEVSEDVDQIFHFAALKCVDSLESQPMEAIETNVIGTRSVLAAQWVNQIDRVILSSTDKAAYPINVYGNTKALAEKLVLQNKRNVVCRYGNVLASRGSVIPMFVKSIQEQNCAYITHESMTRFFIRIEDAAAFVYSKSQEIFGGLKVPEMKATYMTHIAETIGRLLGKPTISMQCIGVRPGEKLHECLSMEHEGKSVDSLSSRHFTPDELTELLKPIVETLR
jgi:UDP-N-acetylglucosamine 4,6-dehydratase